MWQQVGLQNEYCVTFEDPTQGLEAWCKKDGCFELKRYFNGGQEFDQIHICNLDKLIAQLQELKEKATRYFGGEWPQ